MLGMEGGGVRAFHRGRSRVLRLSPPTLGSLLHRSNLFLLVSVACIVCAIAHEGVLLLTMQVVVMEERWLRES